MLDGVHQRFFNSQVDAKGVLFAPAVLAELGQHQVENLARLSGVARKLPLF